MTLKVWWRHEICNKKDVTPDDEAKIFDKKQTFTNLRQKHANACFHTPLNIRKNHILRLLPQCMKLHSKCGYYSVGAHNFVLLFNHYHTTRKNLRNQQLQHISPLVCLLSWTNPLWCKTIRRNKDKWYIFSSDGHPMHIPWPSATHQPPSVPRMIDNRKTSVVTISPSAGIEYTNIQYINLRFRFNVDCYVDFSPKSGIDLYSFSLSYPVDYPQVMNEKRNSDITFKKNKHFNATAFLPLNLLFSSPQCPVESAWAVESRCLISEQGRLDFVWTQVRPRVKQKSADLWIS